MMAKQIIPSVGAKLAAGCAIAITIALFAAYSAPVNSTNGGPVMSAVSPRTSASEVDNADGSPVSGRDPAAQGQRTLSETASRPGVFTTSLTDPQPDDEADHVHDGHVYTSHSH